MAVAQRRSAQAQRTIAAVMREVVRWKENAEVQDKRHSEVRRPCSGTGRRNGVPFHVPSVSWHASLYAASLGDTFSVGVLSREREAGQHTGS